MAITVEEIAAIKELQAQGFGPYQISAQVGADPKTVRKYMRQDDFSPAVPQPKSLCGKLAPWIPTIRIWLEEDQQNRHKQRHTAKRIYDRLVREDPAFSCSYRTVSRYVAEWKAERRQGHGAQELVWHPGECQADFGECDMYVRGSRVVVKYLVVTFPYSNVGYLQCFHGETAECLCQGLKDIFHYIGGVPRRVVIDNATGAGRRMGEVVHLTELFQRFKAHYGFSLTFCNLRSGNEKGNVENKVGYFRRNILVPIPKTESLEHFNTQVLEECELEATPRQEEFLYRVLSQEPAHRERLRRERLLKRAAFPVRKTLDDYEWTALRLPAALPAEDVTSCNFVRLKRNLILYGPVGTGKTHLAIALGVAACEAGLETRFFTAAALATKLDEARRNGSLEKLMQSIDRAELVILDEWGYLPLEKEQAQLLFQLISSCYERRSLIITTNLEFSKWGTIFTDDQMAAAMIDRLAHHGHLLTFEGQSYRLRNALMRVK